MQEIAEYKGAFHIATDKEKLDVEMIHNFLSTKAYWSMNIPREKVHSSISNSLCFGVYHKDAQIGFARVISDFATIAYLGDVFIVEEYRRRGLAKWLVGFVMKHPRLQGLRRWILVSGDAKELYAQYGWADIKNSKNWMEIHNEVAYQ